MSAQVQTATKETYEERITRERAEEQTRDRERRQYFLALVPQVVAVLGEGWTYETPRLDQARAQFMERILTGPAPETLTVGLSLGTGYNERMYKNGCRLYARSHYAHPGPELEYNHRPSATRFEIGIDWQATPEKIAKEIRRRLLPDYAPSLAKYREQVAAIFARLDQGAAARAQIEQGTGEKFHQAFHGQTWNMNHALPAPKGTYSSASVEQTTGTGDCFDFKASSLTAAQVIRLTLALRAEEA